MLKSYLNKNRIEAGIDEAGRGCLAGPVVAAAVILPNDFYHPEIKDSKKIDIKKRFELREVIQKEALAFAIGVADEKCIDCINILNATYLAMHQAIEKLNIKPQHLLIDGNRFKNNTSIPHTCVVKGDNTFLSIAAASILAKTFRDEHMMQLHIQFPQYAWNTNFGYGTKKHVEAMNRFGMTEFHRLSFHIKPKQLILNIE
jgi:ribonuclease HII